MASAEWQVVCRRHRKFPDNWKTGGEPTPTVAKPFTPYAPTYAQIVQRNTIRHPNPPKTPTPSPPSSPNSTANTEYYVSPHSPTHLRFPPSARYAEWRGRCFRCCRQGHTKALCRNNLKCGKCWHEGHVGSQCKKPSLNPAAVPFKPVSEPVPEAKSEPLFEDLLTGHLPVDPPEMPEGRPDMVRCYIPRDESIYKELDKLARGVVLHSNLDHELSIDTVAAYAVRTGLVKAEDVSISMLPRRKYLIMLPARLDPQDFIKATPWDLWDFGYEFQLWSPHDEASITIPSFKVLVHLHGLPVYLWKEQVVINAVSSFGTYLGSLAPPNPAGLVYWAAVVATEDLRQIPHAVSVRVGGMDYSVEVQPIKWVHNLLYKASDLPPIPQKFTAPPPSSPDSSSEDRDPIDDSDLIPMRRSVLREICKGRDVSSLPSQLRELMAEEEGRNLTCHTQCATPATENPAHGIVHRLGSNPQLSHNSPDLLSPQLERLCETGHLEGFTGQSTQLQNEGVAFDLPNKRGSQQPRILQRAAGQVRTANAKEGEVGHNEATTQLVTPNRDSSFLAEPQKKRGRPRGSGQKSASQIGDSPNIALHRTLVKEPISENSDALQTSQNQGQQMGHRSSTIQLVGSAPYNLRPQQIRQTRQSKNLHLNKEGTSQSDTWGTAEASNSAPKKGAVSREVQRCLQILAGGSSPLKNKRKSLGRITIPTRPEPQKKIVGAAGPKNESPIQANLTHDGFYEVHVQQAFANELANAYGLNEKDVIQCLQEDNSERQLAHTSPAGTSQAPHSDDEFTPGRFDPDSADELESDED